MKQPPVESAAVARAGYDPESQILEVEFKGGHVYQYYDVPPSVHEALLQADSIGAFVNERVKGVYKFAQF